MVESVAKVAGRALVRRLIGREQGEPHRGFAAGSAYARNLRSDNGGSECDAGGRHAGARGVRDVGQQVGRDDPAGQVAQEFHRGQGDHGGARVHAHQPGAALGSGEVQDKIRALPREGEVADDLGDDLGGRRVRVDRAARRPGDVVAVKPGVQIQQSGVAQPGGSAWCRVA